MRDEQPHAADPLASPVVQVLKTHEALLSILVAGRPYLAGGQCGTLDGEGGPICEGLDPMARETAN